jgi:hypothetical protein
LLCITTFLLSWNGVLLCIVEREFEYFTLEIKYASGGELYKKLQDEGSFSNAQSALYIAQLIRSVFAQMPRSITIRYYHY